MPISLLQARIFVCLGLIQFSYLVPHLWVHLCSGITAPWIHWFLVLIYLLLTVTLYLLFHNGPWAFAGGGGVYIFILFLIFPLSLILCIRWISMLISIFCKQKFSLKRLLRWLHLWVSKCTKSCFNIPSAQQNNYIISIPKFCNIWSHHWLPQ